MSAVNQAQPVLIDACGGNIELVLMDGNAGLSLELSPAQWAALVTAGEALEPMREFRRKRSVEAAREAGSHEARSSRL